MTRGRSAEPEDRIIADSSVTENKYRLFAVEPHGWSTVLLEDQSGSILLVSSVTGNQIAISKDDADRLLAERVYRLWQGDRRWTPLEGLPLVASAFTRAMSESDQDGADAAF